MLCLGIFCAVAEQTAKPKKEKLSDQVKKNYKKAKENWKKGVDYAGEYTGRQMDKAKTYLKGQKKDKKTSAEQVAPESVGLPTTQ